MQLTAFDDFKKWPFTDVDVPDWFYVGVAKTGLPAIIVVCAGECRGGASAFSAGWFDMYGRFKYIGVVAATILWTV